ncbi:MAG: Bug family tripartite tricarboxylate transporter substrate binding protein, partial [Xanthobacteraceae bacterium]
MAIVQSVKLAIAIFLTLVLPAAAQKFPSRNIQFIVPLAAGSTTDVAARLIAQRVAASLGRSIVVENKPGASTMLGSAAVAKAEPDGYT